MSGSVPPLQLKIDSPPPSDPTGGLATLEHQTAKLSYQLDLLERRNVALEPLVSRIQFGAKKR
jgi:hypothetical protein